MCVCVCVCVLCVCVCVCRIVGVRVCAGRKVYEVEWATIGDEEDDHFCTIEHREVPVTLI